MDDNLETARIYVAKRQVWVGYGPPQVRSPGNTRFYPYRIQHAPIRTTPLPEVARSDKERKTRLDDEIGTRCRGEGTRC